ncbi:MAG: response regulator [Rhodospirillales bacterium]|jgi:CheY-like chemotaxis protein|nr:response regulator [Rhodospirillales bacterium]
MSQVILLVEDDESIQDLVKAILEDAGYEVLIAGTGAEMYNVFASTDISLVLLDLGLPDGDALPHIKKIREESKIPIIILTARQKMDDRLMALGLGANDYLTKPIHAKELTLRIKNTLASSRNRASSPSLKAVIPPQQFVQRVKPVKHSYGITYGVLILLFATSAWLFWAWPLGNQAQDDKAIASAPVLEAENTPPTIIVSDPVPAPPSVTEPEPAPLPPTVEIPATLPVETLQPNPEAVLEEKTPLTKAELLGYGWVLNTRCNPMPDIKWWKFKNHEEAANYVLRVYSGDWTLLVKNLTERLAKLYAFSEKNISVSFPSGESLKGEALLDYIQHFGQRLNVVHCLAKAAKEARAVQ